MLRDMNKPEIHIPAGATIVKSDPHWFEVNGVNIKKTVYDYNGKHYSMYEQEGVFLFYNFANFLLDSYNYPGVFGSQQIKVGTNFDVMEDLTEKGYTQDDLHYVVLEPVLNLNHKYEVNNVVDVHNFIEDERDRLDLLENTLVWVLKAIEEENSRYKSSSVDSDG